MPQEYQTEPYFDYDSITDEMSESFQRALQAYHEAERALIESGSREDLAKLMQRRMTITDLDTEIRNEIWVVPVTIHVAGEPAEETREAHDDEEEHTALIQRCKRCKTVLNRWCECMPIPQEAITWWPEDAQVAKATYDGMIRIELFPERELEGHEVLCPDFELTLNDQSEMP